jgi:hypothetical protein
VLNSYGASVLPSGSQWLRREREREFIRNYFKTGVKMPRVQLFRRGYIDGAVVERVGVERIKCDMMRWR